MELSDLPVEMLLELFGHLPPSSLKMAVLVNRQWREVGEDPSLWTWSKVSISNREDLNKLSVRRLQHLREIRVDPEADFDDEDWEALFDAVMDHSSLRQIYGVPYRKLFCGDKASFSQDLEKWRVFTCLG